MEADISGQLVSMWSTVCNDSEHLRWPLAVSSIEALKRLTSDLWRLSVAVASQKRTLSSEGEGKWSTGGRSGYRKQPPQ